MSSFYIVSIKGRNPSYFIQKLIQKNIKIYYLEKKYDEIIVKVCLDDYQEMKKIKTIYQISIIGREGICYYQYLFKKYSIFLGLFFMGICLVIFLSRLIFEVEVVHTNSNIRNMVLGDLEEFGIRKFRFRVDYQKKEKIEKEILKREVNDLEWIEIEEVGTKYFVRVEQRKKDKKVKSCNPRHIVAKKKAMILDIESTEGEIVKKRLNYVEKGDILISGLIHNKEEVMTKKCAIGKVFGEVWYKVQVELPQEYHEENITGRKKKMIEFQFLNREYSFFSSFKTYQKKSNAFFSSKIFPIELRWVQYLETKRKDVVYNLDKVDDVASREAEEKLKTKLGREDVVLAKKVLKKYKKESKIIVEVFLKVREDITAYQDISNIDISKLNEKKEE